MSLQRKRGCRLSDKKSWKELGFSVEEDDAWKVYSGNCGNLYAHRPGSGSPLLLGMHIWIRWSRQRQKAVMHPDGRITSDEYNGARSR